MSEDQTTLSRKDKKAQRDAERAQQKGKKRKHKEVAEPDALPKQDEPEVPDEVVESAPKTSKKRKAGEIFEDSTADPALSAAADKEEVAPPKKKRQRASKKSSRTTTTTTTTTNEDGTVTETTAPATPRFIVFVGNLPFKTTDSSLQKHFAKLQPFTLRHRTDPKTKKSKGFAFLEFENYDRMKTCLKIYHHSMFDPEAIDSGKVEGGPDAGAVMTTGANGDEGGVHPDRRNGGAGRGYHKKKETARKINVELTAGGGGGKSDGRKEKIKEKNVRLNEQRERRAELEKKEKAKKDAKEAKEGGGKKLKKTGANADVVKKDAEGGAEAAEADKHINPARLAMMGR
ncbi:Putative RNA recognition motif domain, nucleotide-binding alpha-beta plait domain superfamily [Septoria linicola]|uniref:RNA recognition motif domain, nucleotide-binding alpha-beta plait domain superfamily n=1 Tax=Septoria linicola TaxID=215465 RepID=A0A9Q9ARQ5_9PEZI|nr:putative RNA recognition motif domain, nucleotide-binding alpha-beta plait domain superfamily [Septoria linicola]USW50953.1 Putative RNA recognition motif domain, nucleotide-binding alpha-beta plait domain superfamily [Septoria linicola]